MLHLMPAGRKVYFLLKKLLQKLYNCDKFNPVIAKNGKIACFVIPRDRGPSAVSLRNGQTLGSPGSSGQSPAWDAR